MCCFDLIDTRIVATLAEFRHRFDKIISLVGAMCHVAGRTFSAFHRLMDNRLLKLVDFIFMTGKAKRFARGRQHPGLSISMGIVACRALTVFHRSMKIFNRQLPVHVTMAFRAVLAY